MKKEIREVQGNLVRITTVDERWYAKPVFDARTKLPTTFKFVPSVTWICHYYPKGIGFMRWLAEHGWDEAQAIKEAAGDRGSKVDHAIKALMAGQTVKMDDYFPNPTTTLPEQLTLPEYEAVVSFAAWHAEARPLIVAQDVTVWNDAHDYAGTLDFCFVKEGALWLVDIKTSKEVYPEHELQVSAYRHTPEVEGLLATHGCDEVQLAILQVGYPRNKKRFKWNPVKDQFDVFLAARQIWAKETAGQAPLQKDYPVSIALDPVELPVAVESNGAAVSA